MIKFVLVLMVVISGLATQAFSAEKTESLSSVNTQVLNSSLFYDGSVKVIKVLTQEACIGYPPQTCYESVCYCCDGGASIQYGEQCEY